MRLIIIIVVLLLVTVNTLTTTTFPKDFVWGTATSAYQIEGGYNEGGRGMSIWDVFSHTPNKTANGETGDIADDHYHKVVQDVQILKELGAKNYRMSLSWSRIMSDGTINTLNQQGIDYYNREIDLLKRNGLDVYVTLYHWDLPQFLHEKYGGWLNATIVQYFAQYADVCYKLFGDRVTAWITLNEPWVTSILGYSDGVNAPGRCTKCRPEGGNSVVEPYLVSHHQLLAHAAAVQIYREKYQHKYNGLIGITLNSDFNAPLTDDPEDVAAAQRRLEFALGWFVDPVVFGDYPESMKQRVQSRLPIFTEQEKQLLKGSYDFVGLNHYTSRYVSNNKSASPTDAPIDWYHDSGTIVSVYDKNGKVIGEQAESDWLYVVPWGMRGILNWIKDRYNNPPLYITENGVDVPKEAEMPLSQALNDTFRLNYLKEYIGQVSNAINIDGCNVKGYFVWSLMDNYEWADGYTKKFGIHYVDYKSPDLRRYTKLSAQWYKEFLQQQQQQQQQ
jgi:beta-glucosidase